MVSRVPPMGPHTVEEKVVEFSVKWLRLCELPFQIANQVGGRVGGWVDGLVGTIVFVDGEG